MNGGNYFQNRIKQIRELKDSNIILALDPKFRTPNLLDYLERQILELGEYLCGVKLNFHVILPLSESELQQLARIAHRKQVQLIADLKINDIYETNKVIIQNLAHIEFDCAIVNPFIGRSSLISLVEFAHSINFGIIALVYMSHPDAVEGYGASVISPDLTEKVNEVNHFYQIFYANSRKAGVDGIVVGGNRQDILREITSKGKHKIPIYSPGIITQGGSVISAMNAGTDYLIIGRAIIESQNPVSILKEIQSSVASSSS